MLTLGVGFFLSHPGFLKSPWHLKKIFIAPQVVFLSQRLHPQNPHSWPPGKYGPIFALGKIMGEKCNMGRFFPAIFALGQIWVVFSRHICPRENIDEKNSRRGNKNRLWVFFIVLIIGWLFLTISCPNEKLVFFPFDAISNMCTSGNIVGFSPCLFGTRSRASPSPRAKKTGRIKPPILP